MIDDEGLEDAYMWMVSYVRMHFTLQWCLLAVSL